MDFLQKKNTKILVASSFVAITIYGLHLWTQNLYPSYPPIPKGQSTPSFQLTSSFKFEKNIYSYIYSGEEKSRTLIIQILNHHLPKNSFFIQNSQYTKTLAPEESSNQIDLLILKKDILDFMEQLDKKGLHLTSMDLNDTHEFPDGYVNLEINLDLI